MSIYIDSYFTGLQVLDARRNKLTTIPPMFKRLSFLEVVNVIDNPLTLDNLDEGLVAKAKSKHFLLSTGEGIHKGRFPAVVHADMCGRRLSMEDAVVISCKFAGDSAIDYFAVFDGHGSAHVRAATYNYNTILLFCPIVCSYIMVVLFHYRHTGSQDCRETTSYHPEEKDKEVQESWW